MGSQSKKSPKNRTFFALISYVNETNELVHIGVNGETISATPTHPFYVYKFGWTTARALRAGDVLVLSNGEFVTVEWVQHEILESPIKVYNFEVEDFHTYFVGENGVFVHNGCKATFDADNDTVELETSKNEYGEAAEHIEDYINNPNNTNSFIIDRARAKKNRKESLKGYPTQKGYDRDEFPMALFEEGGENADIWYIDPHSNRSLGSAIGKALKPFKDKTRVVFRIVD